MMTTASYRDRGGYRSAQSLRPMRHGQLVTSRNQRVAPSKDELREMLAEAVRNTVGEGKAR